MLWLPSTALGWTCPSSYYFATTDLNEQCTTLPSDYFLVSFCPAPSSEVEKRKMRETQPRWQEDHGSSWISIALYFTCPLWILRRCGPCLLLVGWEAEGPRVHGFRTPTASVWSLAQPLTGYNLGNLPKFLIWVSTSVWSSDDNSTYPQGYCERQWVNNAFITLAGEPETK